MLVGESNGRQGLAALKITIMVAFIHQTEREAEKIVRIKKPDFGVSIKQPHSVNSLKDVKEETNEDRDLGSPGIIGEEGTKAGGLLRSPNMLQIPMIHSFADMGGVPSPGKSPKSQLGSAVFYRQSSSSNLGGDFKRRTIKRPRHFVEKLEGLKAFGDSKNIQAAERDLVQKLVVNAGVDMKEKFKMLDLVMQSNQDTKISKSE